MAFPPWTVWHRIDEPDDGDGRLGDRKDLVERLVFAGFHRWKGFEREGSPEMSCIPTGLQVGAIERPGM